MKIASIVVAVLLAANLTALMMLRSSDMAVKIPASFGLCASTSEMPKQLPGERVIWSGLSMSRRGVIIKLWDKQPDGAWSLTFENAAQAACAFDFGTNSVMAR